MKLGSFRPLLGSSVLLLLAACAEPSSVAAAPPTGSAPLAIDLGGSSRIPHIAALAGEGEGYGTAQPASPDHASMAGMSPDGGKPMIQATMPGMSHEAGKPMAQTAMPGMDHGAMGHGSSQSTGQSGSSQSPGAAPQVAQADHVQSSGMVKSVDPSGHKITLSHNAIPAIGWPAMTMEFAVAPSVDLGAIKPDTHVNFMMQLVGGMYVVQSVTPAGGGH